MTSDRVYHPADCSRSEWGSLSIQDRIRAMAEAESKSKPINKGPPITPSQAPAGESPVEATSGNRRSSVIDMWRQREASSGTIVMNRPAMFKKAYSERSFHVPEEKKEATLEEEEVTSAHAGSDPGVSVLFPRPAAQRPTSEEGGFAVNRSWAEQRDPRSTPLQNQSNQCPKSPSHQVVVSPETRAIDSNVGKLWKNLQQSSGTKGDNCTDISSGTVVTESPSTVSSPFPSFARPRAPRGSVLQRWTAASGQSNDDDDRNQPSESFSPTVKGTDVPATPAAPVTPDDDNQVEAPAFSDLKSKWAKFGAAKIQARQEAKVAPNNLSKVNASLRTPEEAPSVDGSMTSNGNNSDGYRRLSESSLQQPILDANTMDQQAENSESPVFTKQDLSVKLAQATRPTPSPSAQVASYMYVKSKPSVSDNKVEVEISKEDDKSGPPHLHPRKFAHRKILLEKHRRRSKGTSESPDRSPQSSTTSDETLNQALENAISEKQQQRLSNQMVGNSDQMQNQSHELMVRNNIPMQTLLAYGENESEFIDSGFGHWQLPHHSKYNSLLVPGLETQECRKEELFHYEDPGLQVAWPSEHDYEVALQPTKSMISSRAQKTLRDKRNRLRGGSFATEPMQSPDVYTAQYPSVNMNSYGTDEMMFLDHQQCDQAVPRSTRVIQRPKQPSDELRTPIHHRQMRAGSGDAVVNPTFDESTSASTTSNGVSTRTDKTDATGSKNRRSKPKRSRNRQIGMPAEAIVTDKFVSESNTNVEAFRTTFQSMSLEQIANDLKEEATSVLQGVDFQKLSTDWNQGVAAASQTLNSNVSAATKSLSSFVGKEVFPPKKRLPKKPRARSPVEDVAIEVEYVEHS